MSEPFVGEIRMFGGNFAPRGWAFCDGQLLAVNQYDALFSLLGTAYGGDGRTTFGLPDLRGRVPVHMGTGPGLSDRRIGSQGGAENVTLAANEIPSHTHPMTATADIGTEPSPANNFLASTSVGSPYFTGAPNAALAPNVIAASGGGQSHNNVQPSVCVNYIISLFGIYPSRN